MTIVNTTEPNHVLYPGNVHRSIVQEGDDLYVVSRGYGTGVFPSLNEWLAPRGWTFVDNDIRHELNPSIRPPGFVTERIRDSAASVPSRYNVWEYDYPDSGGSNSTLPAASTSTPRQRGLSAAPAFAPDAVYSPMGDFYGNFPDTSGTGKSQAAFTPSRSSLAAVGLDANAPMSLFSQLEHG
jgi:hypothetical protein